MIHLMVYLVCEASLVVQNVDWSNISVFPILIVTNHVEHSNLFTATNPAVPVLAEFTVLNFI